MSEGPLLTLAKVDLAGRVTILPRIGFRIVYLDHCWIVKEIEPRPKAKLPRNALTNALTDVDELLTNCLTPLTIFIESSNGLLTDS